MYLAEVEMDYITDTVLANKIKKTILLLLLLYVLPLINSTSVFPSKNKTTYKDLYIYVQYQT